MGDRESLISRLTSLRTRRVRDAGLDPDEFYKLLRKSEKFKKIVEIFMKYRKVRVDRSSVTELQVIDF